MQNEKGFFYHCNVFEYIQDFEKNFPRNCRRIIDVRSFRK